MEETDAQVNLWLDKLEVEKENAEWRCALIAYVIGEVPGYNYMCRFINRTWENIAEPDIYLHEDGLYVVRFQSLEDMQSVLYYGPHTINNRPIILKQWTADFNFTLDFLTEIPLCVSFPKLPMSCWGGDSLSRVASAIGKPIFANECTSKHSRISFASILIEVNVTKGLPEVVKVMDPNGRQFLQEVEFDWKPEYCPYCMKVGHVCPPPKPNAPPPVPAPSDTPPVAKEKPFMQPKKRRRPQNPIQQ
ncbi:uncharacterized protein LOC132058037 [Lycium ferocissimum]|uniref:uncharacterized protein LOC132058037 n=1 Tax=Lycium ferocissimum TaxID=112874 RepID=UPI0028157A1D|nr:uncharacterized protein LOC132058037 [Lycium ferocissimum]